MRRIFRKMFRVLRHPLTALVAFLYVGWAVWQAPAGTVVGDLKPGVVRSYTAEYTNIFINGNIFPDGNSLAVNDCGFYNGLPVVSFSEFVQNGDIRFLLQITVVERGIFEFSHWKGYAGLTFYMYDTDTAIPGYNSLVERVVFPDMKRRKYVDAIFERFWLFELDTELARRVQDNIFKDSSVEFFEDYRFNVSINGASVAEYAGIFAASYASLWLTIWFIVIVRRAHVSILADTEKSFASRRLLRLLAQHAGHPVAGFLVCVVFLVLLATVPKGFWLGDKIYYLYSKHPVTEALIFMLQPKFDEFDSALFDEVKGWVYQDVDGPVVIDEAYASSFDDIDGARPGFYEFRVGTSQTTDGLFAISQKRTILGMVLYKIFFKDDVMWISKHLISIDEFLPTIEQQPYFQAVYDHIGDWVEHNEVGDEIKKLYRAAKASQDKSAGFVIDTYYWSSVIMEVAVPTSGLMWLYSMWSFPGWLRLRRRKQRGACLKCGYALEGIVGGVCPECGSVIKYAPTVSTLRVEPPPPAGEDKD